MANKKIKEINDRNTTFYINEEKKAVVCAIHTKEYGDVKGKAICDDKDEFDEEFGMGLAYSRATEKLKTLMLEDDFERCMFYLDIAEGYAKRVSDLQENIDSIRELRAKNCGVEYNKELEGYETKRLKFEYGRVTDKEKEEFKALEAKVTEAKKQRIEAANRRKSGEEHNLSNEVKDTVACEKQCRDAHGRFAPKSVQKEDAQKEPKYRSVLIEMD